MIMLTVLDILNVLVIGTIFASVLFMTFLDKTLVMQCKNC